jgi:gamma-glutamylcyclotransferase (GGCT)/AIG2-like uncharacterized protein YtfP
MATPTNPDMVYLIGYGSFITNKILDKASTIEVCKLPKYRRLWLKTTIFPFVLYEENYPGIHALCYSINKDRLGKMDKYEGVDAGLYTRENITVDGLSGKKYQAFIYIPTEKCIQEYNLSLDKDPNDSWLEEIRKNQDICKKYPQLLKPLDSSRIL